MNNTSREHNLNSSAAEIPSFNFRPSFVYPVATCHILIVAVAVVGNLMVCYAILTNRNLRSNPSNLFIFSLALSDLLTVTLAVPFDIEGLFVQWVWKHGEIMCAQGLDHGVPHHRNHLDSDPFGRQRGSIQDPQRSSESFSPLQIHESEKSFGHQLCNLALQFRIRFTSRHGLAYRRELRSLQRLLFSLRSALLYPQLCPEFHSTTACRVRHLHFKIYLIVRSHHNNDDGDDIRKLRSAEEKKVYSRNVQAAKTISIYVGVFLCCWLPFSSVIMFAFLCDESCSVRISYEARIVLLMFGYLNSALNPFLFALRNSSFKATYTLMIKSLKARRSRPQAALDAQH